MQACKKTKFERCCVMWATNTARTCSVKENTEKLRAHLRDCAGAKIWRKRSH